MNKFCVAVIGSRNYNDFPFIFKYLDSKKDKINSFVSGGCNLGADEACRQYAEDNGFSITIHYPNWSVGKSGAYLRNKKIVEDCDILIAFSTGSKGTEMTIDLAQKLGKKVIIHKVEADKNA